VFHPHKIVSKRKKQKKKKAIQTRRTSGKPKGNGISPEGLQGNTKYSAKPPYLPCHYAVSFWLGGAVGVRLTFATFLFFFGYIFNYSIWQLNAKYYLLKQHWKVQYKYLILLRFKMM